LDASQSSGLAADAATLLTQKSKAKTAKKFRLRNIFL